MILEVLKTAFFTVLYATGVMFFSLVLIELIKGLFK